MTQQEKQLLLRDLSARLPYGVIINRRNDYTHSMEDIELNAYHLGVASYDFDYRGLRPYLRPIWSMTEEEWEELRLLKNKLIECDDNNDEKFRSILNDIHYLYYSHHIDCNGLILKGLALVAPDNMYKTE